MIAVPEKGYWVDGTDHEVSFDHRGAPILSHQTWRAKIETDDTGKCYRRFYVGRVRARWYSGGETVTTPPGWLIVGRYAVFLFIYGGRIYSVCEGPFEII